MGCITEARPSKVPLMSGIEGTGTGFHPKPLVL
jgi:hypothetical protein